jgi:hypothetical protein
MTTEEANDNSGAKSTNNLDSEDEGSVKDHPWGLIFTVIGTVLLDFDADACQSPSRAYMLDVTIPGITVWLEFARHKNASIK